MTDPQPPRFTDAAQCVEYAVTRLGPRLVVGAPLGLGKPNHLLNGFYQYALDHPDSRLEVFTALSLDLPRPGRGLQRRFLAPFCKRHFGDYPRLAYLDDLAGGRVPGNVRISEFYFRSGRWLGNVHAQRHYVSSNYTHVARDMAARGVNVVVQMVATDPQRPGFLSLSCNPDVTLELSERVAGRECLMIAQLNRDLPYMEGDAEVPESFFDAVLADRHQPLFAVPRMPVSDQDYLIGLFASALVRDRGTLQLGIGSLGDAAAYFTGMRHERNARYLEFLEAAEWQTRIPAGLVGRWGGTAPFTAGLYAASEMFMDGFLRLYRQGVLKRRVYDHAALQALLNSDELRESLRDDSLEVLWRHGVLRDKLEPEDLDWMVQFGLLREGTAIEADGIRCPDGTLVANQFGTQGNRARLAENALGERLRGGALLHAAFFLGSGWMYEQLRQMPRDERRSFCMTRVSRINQLYGSEALDRRQRLNARFINTTMKMTLLGAAVSDQLANGQVVSGVGGQYNFVAMAHALDRGRSILMLRSYRDSHAAAQSNLEWEFPHATIPRHLRDIVISEYGVAELRGASDEETVQRLLCITDSRWQDELRKAAVRHGKLDASWRVPAEFRANSPEWSAAALAGFRHRAILSDFPYGSDFTSEELRLARALDWLRKQAPRPWQKTRLFLRALGRTGQAEPSFARCLDRMGLANPGTLTERFQARLLSLALRASAAGTGRDHKV